MCMKKMLIEGNQINNFMSSSGSGTVINYGSGSGSDFITSYGSGYGSGSTSQKVTVSTVPVPVPVPQHWIRDPGSCQPWIRDGKSRIQEVLTSRIHNTGSMSIMFWYESETPDPRRSRVRIRILFFCSEDPVR
jgi:hypothetical protein